MYIIYSKDYWYHTHKTFMKDERKKDLHIMGRVEGRLGRTSREAWADYGKPSGRLLEALRLQIPMPY